MAMKDISDKQVCEAYLKSWEMRRDGGRILYPYDILSEMTGQPSKVCCRAMERACNRGYIEYGVSLRCGWLTDRGERLVRE